jgi:hypothetical protein
MIAVCNVYQVCWTLINGSMPVQLFKVTVLLPSPHSTHPGPARSGSWAWLLHQQMLQRVRNDKYRNWHGHKDEHQTFSNRKD